MKQAKVIPDKGYMGMFRVKWPNGKLSDMVNLSRANDAARQFNLSQDIRERARRRGVGASPMRQTEN